MAATHDKPMNSPFDMGHNQGSPGASSGGAAHGMQEKATGVMDTVKETAQSVAHSVTDFASHAKESVQGFAAGATDTMGHAKDRVMDFGSTAYGTTGDTMKAACDQMTGMIRQYPIPALLVGFGVGFMLAQLMDRE